MFNREDEGYRKFTFNLLDTINLYSQKKKLKNADLAEAISRGNTSFKRIKAGEVDLTCYELFLLAKKMNVPAGTLFYGVRNTKDPDLLHDQIRFELSKISDKDTLETILSIVKLIAKTQKNAAGTAAAADTVGQWPKVQG